MSPLNLYIPSVNSSAKSRLRHVCLDSTNPSCVHAFLLVYGSLDKSFHCHVLFWLFDWPLASILYAIPHPSLSVKSSFNPSVNPSFNPSVNPSFTPSVNPSVLQSTAWQKGCPVPYTSRMPLSLTQSVESNHSDYHLLLELTPALALSLCELLVDTHPIHHDWHSL